MKEKSDGTATDHYFIWPIFFYFCDVTVLFAKLFYFLTIFAIDCNSLNGEDVASFTFVLNLLVIEQL